MIALAGTNERRVDERFGEGSWDGRSAIGESLSCEVLVILVSLYFVVIDLLAGAGITIQSGSSSGGSGRVASKKDEVLTEWFTITGLRAGVGMDTSGLVS